ncbi:hypothetical protein LJC07_05110 [Christensenellaceae bacterium OttesenSCG-928-L17]|nr:hypothetical protein [Christensenellaceae bacterium OttesenSCG-928-L17]
MIRTLSDTAVLPIAGMILTFVLCYELIQLIVEKNNMHEFDTFNIYEDKIYNGCPSSADNGFLKPNKRPRS